MEFFMKPHHSKEKRKENKGIWEIQEAQAKFPQLVEDANTKGYQVIIKKGEPVAIILSKKEFDKISQPKTTLLEFFKAAPYPEIELDIQRI